MSIDIEKYLPYLDQYDWSQQEKVEMIHSVSRMMEAVADKAFKLNGYPLSSEQPKDNNLQNRQTSIDSKDQSISRTYLKAANDDVMTEKGNRHAG